MNPFWIQATISPQPRSMRLSGQMKRLWPFIHSAIADRTGPIIHLKPGVMPTETGGDVTVYKIDRQGRQLSSSSTYWQAYRDGSIIVSIGIADPFLPTWTVTHYLHLETVVWLRETTAILLMSLNSALLQGYKLRCRSEMVMADMYVAVSPSLPKT